jgi:hypothetical protein
MTRTLAKAFVILAVTAGAATAQQPAGAFKTGSTYAGPRVWLGNLNGAVAIGAQAERAFTEPGQTGSGIISGGVGVDYYSWNYDYSFGKWSYSVIPLQAFSNYHFIIKGNSKLDPYVGLALVYSIVNASWEGSGTEVDANGSGAALAGQGGLRYFINESFALQGQVGFGYGTIGLGTSWRF